jgi:hypothetical protein
MTNPEHTYTDDHGQTIAFQIPDDVKDICINLSGGADSAVIAYMTIKYCEQFIPDANIHIITCANVVKGWYNAKWSSIALDRLLELTGTTLIKSHYTYFSDDQRRADLDEVEHDYYNRKLAMFFIHGTTQNPDPGIPGLAEGRYQPRDAGHNRVILRTSERYPGRYRWMPLMYTDKRMVAHLYRHFDLEKSLLPFTRSCEQHASDNTDVGGKMMSHCGVCWWCRERKWAFGEL